MVQDISNPFFASMQSAMEDIAKSEGFTLNVQDGQQDLGAQNNQIDAIIQQGADIILLNAVDSEGIGSAVERAIDAGITVVAVDVDAAGAQAAVSTDNVEAGRQACTALLRQDGRRGQHPHRRRHPDHLRPGARASAAEEVLEATRTSRSSAIRTATTTARRGST